MADFSFLNDDQISFGDAYPIKSDSELGINKKDNIFSKLLSNPNFLKALAKTGANLDPKGVGGAVGSAAYNWITDEAEQKAVAAQNKNQESKMEAFLKAMQGEEGNKLVGNKEDMSTANKITIDDKGINVLYPNKTPAPKFSFANETDELRSIPDKAAYTGLSEEELRGVSPEMLQYLSGNDLRSYQDMMNKAYAQGLANLKYRRESEAAKRNAIASKNAAIDERKYENEKAQRDQNYILEQIRLKNQAKNNDPAVRRNEILLMQLQEKINSGAATREMQKEAAQLKDQIRKDRDGEFVLDKTAPIEQRKLVAATLNKQHQDKVFYYDTSMDILGGEFSNLMKSFDIPSDWKIDGKPIDSNYIVQQARKRNMTIEDIIDKMEEYFNQGND